MSERRAEPPELPRQPDIRPEPEDLQLADGQSVHGGPPGSALEDERPFSNGRGGDQFSVTGDEEEGEEGEDYLSRIREKVELESGTSSTTARPRAKPIKCHTGILYTV